MEDEFETLVQRHLAVAYEIEAIDVEFRQKLSSSERQLKSPWTMSGRKELEQEEFALWKALDEGTIDNAEMISRTVSLMQMYYGGSDVKARMDPT